MNNIDIKSKNIYTSLNRALDYVFPINWFGDELYVQSPIDIFTQEVFYRVDKWARSNKFRWTVVCELDHVLIHLIPLKTL